jgi:hypothetical protein
MTGIPIVDIIASIGGLIIPPAVDFIKKKFIAGEADTPERTAATLATTKPEVLPAFMQAIAGLKEVDIKFFNRDVIGTPSQWIVDLRAAIRPLIVCFALACLGTEALGYMTLNDGTRVTLEVLCSSWFGSRITLR